MDRTAEDEPCGQRHVAVDTKEQLTGTKSCGWKAASDMPGAGNDENSHVGDCGDQSIDESCWCDSVRIRSASRVVT